jgi:hypothetical protein
MWITQAVRAREKWLRALPSRVRIAELPGEEEGYDLTNYINDGHTIEDLEAIVEETEEVEAVAEFVPLPAEMPRDAEEAVDRLNRSAFFTKSGVRPCVLCLELKPHGDGEWVEAWQRWTDGQFKAWLNGTHTVQYEDAEGNTNTMGLGSYWQRSPRRKTYSMGAMFAPGEELSPGYFNTWRGFSVEPVEGDVEPMLDHLRMLVDDDEAQFEELVNRLAFFVQYPGERGEVAIVLRGAKGAGKGMVAEVMLRVFGPAGLHVHNREHLVGRFNGHLEDVAFLVADEAFWSGDHGADAILKGMITDAMLVIERKMQDAYWAKNRMSMMILANAAIVVAATREERRYFIVDASNKRCGDHAYFTRLAQWINDGGVEAWLHYLMSRDLTEFNPRTTVRTSALSLQIEAGLEPIPSVLYQLARDGWRVVKSSDTNLHGLDRFPHTDWPDGGFEIKASEMREYVTATLRSRGERLWEPASLDTKVGKAVKLLGGEKSRPREEGRRINVYEFPNLDTARRTWAELHGGQVGDWFDLEAEIPF